MCKRKNNIIAVTVELADHFETQPRPLNIVVNSQLNLPRPALAFGGEAIPGAGAVAVAGVGLVAICIINETQKPSGGYYDYCCHIATGHGQPAPCAIYNDDNNDADMFGQTGAAIRGRKGKGGRSEV